MQAAGKQALAGKQLRVAPCLRKEKRLESDAEHLAFEVCFRIEISSSVTKQSA